MWLTIQQFFFFFENTKYFQHTYGEMGECFFKETYSGIYPKGSNSWIYSTNFKHFLLTLFLRKCGINPIFFLLIILNIFNIHMEKGEKVFFNTIQQLISTMMCYFRIFLIIKTWTCMHSKLFSQTETSSSRSV